MSTLVLRPHAVFPPLLFVVGFAVVAFALVREASEVADGAAPIRALTVVLYVVWLLAEAKVTFGAAPGESGDQDRGTVYFYGLSRVATAGAALLVPAMTDQIALQIVGLVIFVAGVLFRLTAIRRLGRFYAHQVRTLDDHQVIQDGPYTYVRHPAYAGMVASHVGFVLVFLNVWSVLSLLLVLVPAVVLRIRVEERVLFDLPGYPEFANKRARLVPGLW